MLVPEQSLAAGTLTLRYVPGRISAVQSEGAAGWWRTALPTGPGGELNQRDLDQALENIRRLGSQADASIDVAPGPELGDSDIVIKPGTGKRWHAYIGGDNAGMESTGKEQINAGLTLDSPLFLYDQFSVSWNSNAAFGRDDAATRAGSVNYSIPFGYWTLFAGASRSRYRQTVAGFDEPIIYAGTTKQVDIGVSVVPYRGSTYKGTVMFATAQAGQQHDQRHRHRGAAPRCHRLRVQLRASPLRGPGCAGHRRRRARHFAAMVQPVRLRLR